MNRAILAGLLGMFGVSVVVMSCASASDPSLDLNATADEDVGAVSEGLSKCLGGRLGESDYCSASCKCNLGEGDCDSTNECNVDPTLGQLACTSLTIRYNPTAKNGNACAPLHCANKKQDGDETQVDCGGSCGTFCPNQCASLPPSGDSGHCTTTCRCVAGQGDCDGNDLECTAGNYCAVNAGNSFGFASTVDMCLANTCKNGVKDANEDAVDCGPTCLPCSGDSTLSFAKGGSNEAHGLDVAIDSSAAIVLAGRFGGTTNFGGGALTASGGSDVFVAKYNNVGAHVWSKRLGGNQADGDLNVSVAVDATRSVYVGGNYRGTIDFGDGITNTAVGVSDAFIVKFNANGVAQWSKSYGLAGSSAVRVNGLTVTTAGDVFVAGAFASSKVTFGTTALINQGTDASYDGFVLKLNTNGGHVWSRAFGSTGNDQATNIALDASSVPYVSCSFVGTVEGMTSAGTSDGCLLKLAPATGATTWARRIGGGSTDFATAVEVDSVGPVVTGQFKANVTFDDASTATTEFAGGFVAAYDASGAFRWKKAYTSTTGNVRGLTMAGTSAGVVVLGDFVGTATFTTTPVTATGARDLFMVRYNTGGAVVWATTHGTATALPAGATVVSGMLGVAGDFTDSITFGSETLSSPGLNEAFFTRLIY
jgi:hypothetical protein